MSSKVLGTCRLCLRSQVELQDSHIVPRWAYKRPREPSLANSNPAAVSRGVAVQASRQFSEHLLCHPCEQRFGVQDDYVARLTAATNGPPPLSNLLGKRPPVAGDLVAAHFGQVDVARVVYFGASLVWRGHVSSRTPTCNLGPNAAESFRRFLNHGQALPATVALVITYFESAFVDDPGLTTAFTTPMSEKVQGWYLHTCLICGLRFDFAVGLRVPEEFKRCCVIRSPTPALTIGPTEALKAVFLKVVAGVEAKGSLRKLTKTGPA